MYPVDSYRLAKAHQERLLHEAGWNRARLRRLIPKLPVLPFVETYVNQDREQRERVRALKLAEEGSEAIR